MRLLGHVFAGACAVVFGYTFLVAMVAAFSAGSFGVTSVVLGVAATCLAFVLLTAVYVTRRPYTGGYLLIALACLTASVVCGASIIPLLAF